MTFLSSQSNELFETIFFILFIQRKVVPLCHYLRYNSREVKIIHIDMDQFYAAVEQRDNPELRDAH
jgi:hypothetical protein